MWTWVHITRWVGQEGWHHWAERVLEVRWLTVSRKNQHPRWAGRETCSLVGQWFPRRQTKQTSCPAWGARLILYPIRWWKSRTYTAALGCLWLQVQAELSLWEIPPVPVGGWCREGGSRMKTARDEDKTPPRDAKKCSGITQSWIIKHKCNLQNMKVSKSIGEVAQNFLEPHGQS